jgi:hypothetical protein
LAAADVDHIAEEIEGIGKTEKRELVSRSTVLLLHLLKWQCQPGLRNSSWEAGIAVQRIKLADRLVDNPSLKPKIPEAIDMAYRVGVIEAAAETGLGKTTFPEACPWRFEQVMDPAFWPDAP